MQACGNGCQAFSASTVSQHPSARVADVDSSTLEANPCHHPLRSDLYDISR